MKNIWRLKSVLIATLTIAAAPAAESPIGGGSSGNSPGSDQAAGWQVGYAEADITPAPGEAMLAGFGRPRQVSGTLEPLRAQAVVFQDRAGRRALLFTADVLGFGRDTVDRLRQELKASHGLPASAICFAASHTHWGPAINFRAGFAIGGIDVWYLGRLEETLLRLAAEAIQDLSAAGIAYGACDVQIGLNRRLPQAGGAFRMAPNPAGSYDSHTPVLHITRGRSPRQLVLAGHACHPTSTGVIEKWAPDYPGAMRRKLEATLADSRALFVMGCGGDAKVAYADERTGQPAFAADPQRSAAAGDRLGDHILDQIRRGEMSILEAELETRLVSGMLSLREPRSHEQIREMAFGGNPRSTSTWWARQSLAYPDQRRVIRYEVQTWRLGDLTSVALEGEVCADWGPRVRALAKTRHAMVIAYANEVAGYIPTARIIDEGGYEGNTSHMAYFLPAPFDPKMEAELLALIEQALELRQP